MLSTTMATLLHLLPLTLFLSCTVAFVPSSPEVSSPFKIRQKSNVPSDINHNVAAPDFSPQVSLKITRLYSTPSDETTQSDFPIDSASTTPQLLAALWTLIAQASTTMIKGETKTILFPNMAFTFTPTYLTKLMGHLDACKDVCDYFGTKTVLLPYIQDNTVQGFTAKSFRNPNTDKEDEYEFDYDPFWDDGDDWDYEGVDAEVEGILHSPNEPTRNIIPTNDEEILATTQTWVAKMMSDMGICPFTSGSNQAGLPMGPVHYTIDRSTQMEDVYARYWQEVVRVEASPQDELSTTLLIAPEFCMDNIELFESFSNTLTQPLQALGLEDLLQLVFFHPQWTFRDGGERSGMGAAANYARRSPWPMINLLRTTQVRTAQRGIPTGLVYQQNERTLTDIGAEKLETMLQNRDWSDISDIHVNRRDMEALRVAQDYQQTGILDEKDTSFEFDATPAANKVNRNAQTEGGNMVNVVLQALSKRLEGQVLSGPETSATVMASDFILEELQRIVDIGGDVAVASTGSSSSSSGSGIPTTQEERMLEAKRMILQDLEGDATIDSKKNGDELNAMFGSGGISTTKSEDEKKGGGKFDMFY